MGDDLSAFFAKKAQKKDRKKKAVNLDDVGQQLERKVKIQETGEEEYIENDSSKDQVDNIIKMQTNEDSEWIEYSEKTHLGDYGIKEFVDQPDDGFEEEKRDGSGEGNKTWNVVNPEKTEVIVPQTPIKSVYQAPGSRSKAIDINNQDMFPSIAAADEIAEKLKAEEKKKGPTKPEEQFETQRSHRQDLFRPSTRSNYAGDDGGRYGARTNDDQRGRRFDDQRGGGRTFDSYGGGQRRGGDGYGSNEPPAESVSDTTTNWRSSAAPPSRSQPTMVRQQQSEQRQHFAQHHDDDGGSKVDESENWRSTKKRVSNAPPAKSLAEPVAENKPSGAPRYVPPHERRNVNA